jgi:hypothetical protein
MTIMDMIKEELSGYVVPAGSSAVDPYMGIPTSDDIGKAIDALHAEADEQDRIHSIPAFRMLNLGE